MGWLGPGRGSEGGWSYGIGRDMPHELPKAYEPGAIEARWAEYWVREKLFHVETPEGSGQWPVVGGRETENSGRGLKPPSRGNVDGTAEAVSFHNAGPHDTAASRNAGPSHNAGPAHDAGRFDDAALSHDEGQRVFTLLLPPPNVTGRLHMGHMLNQTQMDIIVRWHRMRGFVSLWLPGTDHAGIATQMMVERQLLKEGKKRREMGREKFIERVWEWRREYGGAILDQMKRLGASVDWGREYFTMDEKLSRAVKEVFVRLYEDGLIYRGKYIVNWCADCGTAISDLEVKHEDVAGKLYEIRYPVVGSHPRGAGMGHPPGEEYITVATTRPETMLGDTAIAVNPTDERYLHLHGKRVMLPLMNREIPIIADELAQPEFGTGAVKVTPAHDPNDFEAGLRHNLPQIEVIDEHAKMNGNAGPYAGLDRFAARARIVEDLEAQGFLVGTKDYTIAIGKCDRSGTIVEPRLSTQWFIKIAPLAKRAIEVVEKGYIRFTPENYGQIYLNWMNNIHDWCISRQLWWGHRIPAWYCRNEGCKEVVVAREAPAACGKCGGTLEQDTDVLDTWFSSGLLPFTTLGWPEATPDLATFYPNSLMITGFDILFFWVARMIMLGCWFMMPPHKPRVSSEEASSGEDPRLAPTERAGTWGTKDEELLRESVPFREVYIHALVRDADRQKMSKTKGNVLDPIEVIGQYGTDATRFTLAAMAAPGTDIAFSESRTAGYRNFANKIWNAARLMFMNVDRIDAGLRPGADGAEHGHRTSVGVAGFETKTLEDRWILSRFNRAAADVNASLQNYRFDEAATRIYDFFWGEFCDWYLELIKSRLNFEEGADTTAARAACANLVNLYEASLRLLHPVMPFITEEIWHAIYDGKPPLKSIALAAYPAADERQIDLTAETEMAILQDLIVSIRNLRAELKVEPKVKIPVEVFAPDAAMRAMLENNLSAVLQDRPANVETVTFVDRSLANLPGARSTSRFDVHAIYEKKIDVAAERERLKKELEKIEKQLTGSQARLGNEQFVSKAPGHVVEGLRKQVEEMTILREKILGQLKELGE
jgi:valyl-tRNA synthetase